MIRAITSQPPRSAFARFAAGTTPRFLLTVDTEEEFDWDKPLSRERHGLAHLSRLAKFQEFCENQQVVPVYLVDWPVAQSPLAAEILRAPLADGRAEIGVQLHPWVNPPFDEDVCQRNSFAGNLPRELERAKLLSLRDAIETNFGVAPRIYRAGRYGTGPHTAELLREAGIAIDTSVRSLFDYSAAGGPNYREHPLHAYWLDDAQSLLELPLTTTFWGLLHKQGSFLYPALWRAPRLRGLLARIGLLERIPLTPEGVAVAEAIRGIDMALDGGLPLLVLSFHSPSICPGFTPYVRTEDDLDQLYDWWRRIFSYLRQRGVHPTTVAGVLRSVDGRAAA